MHLESVMGLLNKLGRQTSLHTRGQAAIQTSEVKAKCEEEMSGLEFALQLRNQQWAAVRQRLKAGLAAALDGADTRQSATASAQTTPNRPHKSASSQCGVSMPDPTDWHMLDHPSKVQWMQLWLKQVTAVYPPAIQRSINTILGGVTISGVGTLDHDAEVPFSAARRLYGTSVMAAATRAQQALQTGGVGHAGSSPRSTADRHAGHHKLTQALDQRLCAAFIQSHTHSADQVMGPGLTGSTGSLGQTAQHRPPWTHKSTAQAVLDDRRQTALTEICAMVEQVVSYGTHTVYGLDA